MKLLKRSALALMLVVLSAGIASADAYRPYTRTVDLTVKNVPVFEAGLGVETAGSVWYVDSGASGTAAGTSWTNACLTLDAAINLASAGDLIRVAELHAETISAANGWDADVAGITIYHHGSRGSQATYTFTATASTVAIGAANVTVIGGKYLAGVSAVVMGVSVEAAGDGFTFISPFFPEPTTSSYEFVDAIDLASGADDFTLIDAVQFTADATGAAHFIDAGNGVNNRMTIINPYLYGEYSVSAIWSDTTDLEVLISGGNITNATNGQHAIEFVTGTALGTIENILVRTDEQSTAVDPGSMSMHNVYWADDAVADAVATPVVLGAAGIASIGTVNATTTDQLHGKIGTDTEMADSSLYDLNVADQIDLDAILADTADLQPQGVRSVSKVLTTIMSGNNDIFVVAGGPIKIIEIIGIVTTEIEGKSCLINYNMDPTSPAGDTVFGTDGTALEINGDTVGALYTWNGVVANDLIATDNGVALGVPTYSGIVVPAGSLELAAVVSTSATGAITFYIRYMPLSNASVVTAAP